MSTQDDTDPQPTPEPWEVKQGTVLSRSKRGKIKHIASLMASAPSALDESGANGKLIAAAGTAAGKLPDRYDAIELLRNLPEIARLIDRLHDETHRKGGSDLSLPLRMPPSRETVDHLISLLQQTGSDS